MKRLRVFWLITFLLAVAFVALVFLPPPAPEQVGNLDRLPEPLPPEQSETADVTPTRPPSMTGGAITLRWTVGFTIDYTLYGRPGFEITRSTTFTVPISERPVADRPEDMYLCESEIGGFWFAAEVYSVFVTNRTQVVLNGRVYTNWGRDFPQSAPRDAIYAWNIGNNLFLDHTEQTPPGRVRVDSEHGYDEEGERFSYEAWSQLEIVEAFLPEEVGQAPTMLPLLPVEEVNRREVQHGFVLFRSLSDLPEE